jgi:multidrug efflux pump subunit AcrB
MVIAGALLGATLIIALLTPPAEYLPEGEEPKTFARMIAPPGYNLTEMESIARQVMAEVLPALEDEPQRFESGETDLPALAYVNLSVDTSGLRIITEPKDPSQINAVMDALDARFLKYPGMRAFSSRGSIISSNDGGTRSINLDISGPDLAELYRVGERVYRRAGDLFEGGRVGSNPSSLSLDQPLVEIRPRWERLAEAGLDAQGFGFTMTALSDGAYLDELILGDDKIDIHLFSSAGSEQQLDRLRDLPVATPLAGVLPVSALADLVETASTAAITTFTAGPAMATQNSCIGFSGMRSSRASPPMGRRVISRVFTP